VKVLIVDNYDSFTYNLKHYVEQLDVDVVVKRNDELTLDEVKDYDRLILSPGPGLPSETPMMYEILERFHQEKPILGVCLGMQGIAEYFGGKLRNQEQVKHGVATIVTVTDSTGLFEVLPPIFKAGLYHSWCVDEDFIPESLFVSSISEEGIIMSIEHDSLPIYGVQFHPESVMTDLGIQILANFLH
jgi:anthranilate synthase component 2